MKYIVGGLNRTGTTALIHALALASQMPIWYNQELESVIRSREIDSVEYNPNPNTDYYAHNYLTRPASEWIDIVPDNNILKMSVYNLTDLPQGDWNIVLTNRSIDEIQLSYSNSFGGSIGQSFIDFRAQIEEDLTGRSDVNLSIVNYSDLVNNTLNTFNLLLDNGWPIDPEIAASTIYPNLYRSKI